MNGRSKQGRASMHADGDPSPWITRFAPLVRPGAAVLDVACGGGRHTRLFLGRGHPVTAVDVDISGLGDLRRHPQLELVQADLEDGSPWPLPGCRFGAVVVTNYLWRPLFPPILASIDEDGVLLYETFARGNEAYGRPANPDFLLEPGELIEVVRERLQTVAYEHGHLEHPMPAIKQRLCALRSERPASLGSTS
jgi:SAM-dependent methyltransferase